MKRFELDGKQLKDNEAKDTLKLYELNREIDREHLVDFINSREDMIINLNNEITRLHEVLDESHIEYRNISNKLRKQERVTLLYKEMVQLMMELIGEIE